MNNTNKPIQLRTGNVVKFGEPIQVDGKEVWPIDLHILTGEPLYQEEMGGANGWFVIDLESVVFHKPRLTMDYNHDEKEIIGYAEDFTTDETGLHGKGYLVPFDEKDRASEIIYKNKAGVPYEMSPTVLPYDAEIEELPDGETATVNGRDVIGPMRIYRKLPIRGKAICPYGTDRNTSATVLSEKGSNIMAKSKAKLSEGEKKVEDVIDPEKKEELSAGGEYTAFPELEKFIAEFGEAQGVEFYRKGMSFEDAQQAEYTELKAAKMAKLNEEKEQESEPATTGDGDDVVPTKKDDPATASLKAQVAKLSQQVAKLTAATPRTGEKEPVSSGTPEKKPKPDDRPAVMKLADKYKQV